MSLTMSSRIALVLLLAAVLMICMPYQWNKGTRREADDADSRNSWQS